MKKNLLAFSFIASVSTTSVVMAEDLSYTYIEANYLTGEIENIDGSGYHIAGSAALSDSFFILGSYSDVKSDDQYLYYGFAGKLGEQLMNLNLGFNTSINDNVDFVTYGGYTRATVDLPGFGSISGDGFNLNAGVRSKPTDKLELNGFVNYTNIESTNETGVTVGARYFFVPKASIGLTYNTNSYQDILSIGVRLDF